MNSSRDHALDREGELRPKKVLPIEGIAGVTNFVGFVGFVVASLSATPSAH